MPCPPVKSLGRQDAPTEDAQLDPGPESPHVTPIAFASSPPAQQCREHSGDVAAVRRRPQHDVVGPPGLRQRGERGRDHGSRGVVGRMRPPSPPGHCGRYRASSSAAGTGSAAITTPRHLAAAAAAQVPRQRRDLGDPRAPARRPAPRRSPRSRRASDQSPAARKSAMIRADSSGPSRTARVGSRAAGGRAATTRVRGDRAANLGDGQGHVGQCFVGDLA